MDKIKFFTVFAKKYRRFLYLIHGIPSTGIMSSGSPCHVEDPTIETTHGDVVHPCVRFIEDGFEGHQWWLVYTPLYAGDDSLENPRLFYSDAKVGQIPTEWKFYCMIKDCPRYGYNSDPTMLFKDEKLYVFWRECDTPTTKKQGCSHATMGCSVKNHTVTYFTTPLMTEGNPSDDKEVCPTFISTIETLKAYAMHLHTPVPKIINFLPSKVGSFIYRHHLLAIAEGLGLYDSAKSRGVAVWEGLSFEKSFHYKKTAKFKNVSSLYQPWHMDIFIGMMNGKEMLFAIIQSSIKFADICLAWSEDGENFRFFNKPLITSRNIKMDGLYKPTALVVGDIFFLFYTARDNNDHHLNKLFVTSMKWSSLLQQLSK